MKINSELPFEMLSKFNLELNDIDFVLFHLYITDDQYRQYYKTLRNEHPDRVMILDNSAYEFFIKHESLDLQRFREAVEDLNPTYYILPDVLMDQQSTLQQVENFLDKYVPNCDSEPIAVAQGMTEDELIECLHIYSRSNICNVCIPFHNIFFKKYPVVEDEITKEFMTEYGLKYIHEITDDMKYAMGRIRFVRKHWFLLKTFEYVHLLGSHCPFEKKFYKDFDSMDTGYPVKLGYVGESLGKEIEKPNVIIDDFFHEQLSSSQTETIYNNVMIFKNY